MNSLVRTLCLTLAVVPATAWASPALRGTYSHNCGPTDGPAFLVTLPLSRGRGELLLQAYTALDQAVGHWPQFTDHRTMPSTILLCHVRGGRNCAEASGGEFQVDRVYGGTMTGRVYATFAQGRRVSGRFVARYRQIALACG